MTASSGPGARGTVLIQGNFEFYRLGASFGRAFEELGWHVVRCDVRDREERLSWWLRNRHARRLTIRSGWLRRRGSRGWSRRVWRDARDADPDLVLVIGGNLLTGETLRRISDEIAPTVVFFPDDPFPGSTNHRPELREVARAADHCLIWSRSLVERMSREWKARASYLPFAWDPDLFPSEGASSPEGHDVVFIGGWDRWRERWLKAVAPDFDLKIWGPDYWKTRTRDPAVRRCWQGRALFGDEAATVIGRSAVVLNVFRRQNLPDGTNMRTFEVPGAGGFSLSHRSDGAEEIFPAGEAGAYFGTRAELVEQLDRCLASPGERMRIAGRAREVVRAGHRYVDRARTILQRTGLTARSGEKQ